MKRAKLIALATLLLAGAAAWGQEHSATAEQQVKTLHQQEKQAALNGDAKFFQTHLSDDYLRTGPDGSVATKNQYLQMLTSGVIKYAAIDERDVNVRVYADTAVINVLAFVKLTLDGKPISGDYRATFVLVKQHGTWKEVSSQVTRVAARIPRPGNNLGHDAPPARP